MPYLCAYGKCKFLKTFSFLIFILYVWVFGLNVCLWNMCMPDAQGSQKRALASLELELWMVEC